MAIGTTPTADGNSPMVMGSGQVSNPWGSAQSPAQYFLSNGGNPAMLQNFLYWMSSAPANLAPQMAANPKLAFQMYTQGTGYDPSAKGLTQNQQGQFVNSSGAVYDSQTDPQHQAEMAAQNQQWQDMFLRSPLWNRGGQLNVTPDQSNNFTGIDPSITNTVHNPLTLTTPTGPNTQSTNQVKTPYEQSLQNQQPTPPTQNPTPGPTTPGPGPGQGPTTVQPQTKATPALSNTGTANYNPYVAAPGAQAASPQNAVSQAGGGGQGSGGLNIGNPYNSTKPGNPYTFNSKGWNL